MVNKSLFTWRGECGRHPSFQPLPSAGRVKGGEGWVKGRRLPFTPANALFIGVSGQKVKGEGLFLIHPSDASQAGLCLAANSTEAQPRWISIRSPNRVQR